MEAIEQQALQIYQANMAYFSKEHPELHKKLELFNMAIESGQYKERYALEYKEGYFDILDLQSGHFLYGDNSTKISEKVAKEVHFKKTGNVIESFYNIRISKENAQTIHDAMAISDTPLYAAANIVQYVNSTVPKEKTSLKRLEKYIFFGVGVGTHLELIQKKIKATKVWVVEDDLELFRLSLFTLNYATVFSGVKLFFSVAHNDLEFRESFEAFFTAGYNHNQYLKYSLISDRYVARIKQIQDFIVTEDYLAYPYSMQLRNLLQTPEYLVEGYNYVDLMDRAESGFFTEKPVLLLAAGPSLKKHIDWLKANQDKFIIVAVLATLQTLHANGIKPDVITNIDSSRIILKFFEGIDTEAFLADTLFLFSSMVNKAVVDKVPNKENIYFFESTTHYKKAFGALATPSVGETTYGLLLQFGVKELYLLGLDLALDPETKQKYANEAHEPGNISEPEDIYNTQLASSVTYVKGNFLETVPTLPLFKTSIHDFGKLTKNMKTDDCRVYNLNNGALLEGAQPFPIEQVGVNAMQPLHRDTQIYHTALHGFFTSRSENFANPEDIANLERQISEAVRIYEIVQSYKNKKSYSSVDSFFVALSGFINEILGVGREDQTDINAVMFHYIRWVSGYIFELFYTQELNNPKKHIKYINSVLISQVEKMLTLYIKTLRVYKLFAEDRLAKRNAEM